MILLLRVANNLTLLIAKSLKSNYKNIHIDYS